MGLQQPGWVELRHEMPDVVLGQEVPDWGRISPRQPDTKSRQERGA